MAALVLLFSAAAVYESVRLSSLNAPEVWVHLRTGSWIDRAAFTAAHWDFLAKSQRWNDTTWGYDLLLGTAYRILDLRAIPILLMALKVAVAASTFLLAVLEAPASGGLVRCR